MIFSVIKNIVAIFLMMLGFMGCGQKTTQSNGSNRALSLPAMVIMNEQGSQIDLTSLKGKRVFVNLWATWCPPCVAEMPSIQALYNKTNSEKTAFVLISFDKNFETAKDWMKQKQFNMPIYDGNTELPELFQVEGIPTTFIFNENGEVIFSTVGSENYATQKFVNLMTAK